MLGVPLENEVGEGRRVRWVMRVSWSPLFSIIIAESSHGPGHLRAMQDVSPTGLNPDLICLRISLLSLNKLTLRVTDGSIDFHKGREQRNPLLSLYGQEI